MLLGPTSCGKSFFVRQLLLPQNELIVESPESIMYCYGQYQPLFDTIKSEIDNIQFVHGIPDNIEDYLTLPKRKLVILDDVMQQVANDSRVTKLFVQGSHHMNLSVVLVLQNLFYQGPQMRTISLNSHYMVLFKNSRDRQQVHTLSRQLYPHQPKALLEAFNDATKEPYKYLILNMRPDTPDQCRMLTNILPEQHPVRVYIPSKSI